MPQLSPLSWISIYLISIFLIMKGFSFNFKYPKL